MAQLAVAQLREHVSARTQGVDHSHVELLAQCPDPLPPIVVHKSSLRVIDGLHRLCVAQRRGLDEIGVAFFDGSDEEAFALSALLNVRHGLPLPIEDRKAAAARILRASPGWSDRFVAGLVGLSHKTISNIRRCSTGEDPQLNARLGQDGKVRPIDPAGGRLRAAEILGDNPELSLRQLARLAEISLSTARDVRLRLLNGEDPVPDRLRSTLSSSPTADVDGGSMPTGLPLTNEHHRGQDATPPPLGGRKRREPASRGNQRTASFDLILERLKKDPAIRFNEAGRNLIRQLVAAHSAVTLCRDVIPSAPAHCLAAVAQIAENHAEAWRSLAAMADARAEVKHAL